MKALPTRELFFKHKPLFEVLVEYVNKAECQSYVDDFLNQAPTVSPEDFALGAVALAR